MVNIMRGVVERGTAAASVGKLPFPLAGKTGTTNEAKDTWFVGFSPDLAAGVFVGFDQPRTLGGREQGATVAAPIFAEFMASALEDTPPIDFRIPPGVRLVRVNPATGKLAEPGATNTIWEAFKPDTEPTPSDQVVEGGPGIETLSSDDAAPGSIGGAIEPGVVAPGDAAPVGVDADSGAPPTDPSQAQGTEPGVAAPGTPTLAPQPTTPQSTATGGLY
jgi:penicillin-binding protein 1A